MKTLILVRGLSGSGKTSLANRLNNTGTGSSSAMFAADDYFHCGGKYRFDPKLLPAAHAYCQEKTEYAMITDPPIGTIIVHNTFCARWEIEPYFKLATQHGYHVVVVSLFDAGLDDEALAARNVHEVPVTGIARQRKAYEHDWKVGDPCPPWERV